MLKWITKVLAKPASLAQPDERPGEAKRYLDELREGELSIGAAMRRGESVSAAPGQTVSVRSPSPLKAREKRDTPISSSSDEATQTASDADFATSLAVGMATGDTGAGYLIGGSIAGSALGAAMNSGDEK